MKVVFGNQTAAKLYGYESVEEALGVDPTDFIHSDDKERALKVIKDDLFEKGLRQVNEFRTITRDGRETWISAIGTRTEYQGRSAVLVSIRDITEQKKMEEEKQRLEAQLHLSGRLAAIGALSAGGARDPSRETGIGSEPAEPVPLGGRLLGGGAQGLRQGWLPMGPFQKDAAWSVSASFLVAPGQDTDDSPA